MRHYFFLFLLSFSLCEARFEANLGGQLNYIRMKFDNPDHLDGYLGGVTAKASYCYLFAQYEGYWSAPNLCGRPCQESSVSEHLAYGAFQYPCFSCFVPYIGFGYNVFNNSQDPETACLTYQFKKWVVPVGFTFWWRNCLGFQAEWRPDVNARIELLDECFDSERQNAFRVQLPLVYRQRCYSLQFVPFYDWNQFGKTTEDFDIPTLIRWDVGARLLVLGEF